MEHQEHERPAHWKSRILCITAVSAYELAKRINDCYADKFVVGTQTFRPTNDDKLWTAFVYFKTRP